MNEENQIKIPEELAARLEKHNWYPEYSFDVAACEKKLGKRNLILVPAAKRFLERFGGLSFSNKKGDRVYLNPTRVLRTVNPARIHSYEPQIPFSYSPIGEGQGGQMCVLMDDDCNFYFARDEGVINFAKSTVDALRYFVE